MWVKKKKRTPQGPHTATVEAET